MGLRDIIKKEYKSIRKRLHDIKHIEDYHNECEKKISELEDRIQWFKDHADICALKPATGYLRKKQMDLIEFTNAFFEEISSLNLKPFLICGNLIGAYRHQGYVPWDDDLDFGLMREEYEKLIEYCKEHYTVEIYTGKWSEYSEDKHIARMDKLVKTHPNEYILDIWIDQIQIMKGTSCIDRLAVDFWSFDYYSEEYPIEDHLQYLKEIDKKKHQIDHVDKIIDYLKNEIKTNTNISSKKTSKVFPGIDNVESYTHGRMEKTKDWLYTNELFPLKKCRYENTEYYIPNNPEKWLNYEYPDYMSFPDDVGVSLHLGYRDRYIRNNYPCVEFYLVDSFEIFHFKPLYDHFEKNGIFPCFIAEKPEDNVSGEWFDYEEAKKYLDNLELRYRTKCDPEADYAFTTQDAYLLRKYHGKKVHLQYGTSLINYSFCENERTINGFDLKLVNGSHTLEIVRKKHPELHVMDIGYPKYYSETGNHIIDDEVLKSSVKEKNIYNKPILVYFPTWDKQSTILYFAEEIKKLREQFFVITKAHHCTFRLESEKDHLRTLYDISDMVLSGNYSFSNAAAIADIALCDAKSGAATEVPLINRKAALILLYSEIKEMNDYKDIITEYAYRAEKPEGLPEIIEKIKTDGDLYLEKREIMLRSIYTPYSETLIINLINYLKDNYEQNSSL